MGAPIEGNHSQMGYESTWSPSPPAGRPAVNSARPLDRLDGWKSVAAYLGRDRTTVIRWARERALPVYRLPGGKTATVYALKSELDRWAGAPDVVDGAEVQGAVQILSPPKWPSRGWQRWAIGMAAIILAVGTSVTVAFQPATPTLSAKRTAASLTLPKNPEIAANFLTARDLVVDREAAGLERAIALLEQIIRDDPLYAPGHASLAEALLLSREFGMRSNRDAFPRALLAARTANRLAPDDATGYRLLGFVAYWADHDFPEADAKFRRAISLDANDPLINFWYGNILSDHGDHKAALEQLNRARLMEPGSVAIRTDLAWAHWAAGHDELAVSQLTDIAKRHPNFAVAQDCLAIIAFVQGDDAGYAEHFARFAALKQDPFLIKRAQAVSVALRAGVPALKKEMMRQALDDAAQDVSRTYVWPTMIASTERNRSQVLSILKLAKNRKEQWGEAGLLAHIKHIWKSDPEIISIIEHIRQKY